jgi:hypothetical protein
MAFLYLVQGPGDDPEIAILHWLMRYMDMPGEEPSGYHDKVIGLLGDILPHQYPTTEVPGTVFHLVNTPVRVPTTAGMLALIPTWEDPSIPLGPYGEDVPETEVVRPRHVQLIPGYYAAILVQRRGVSAKTAFQELHGAMQARDKLVICRVVLTWLNAAATARGGGGLQNGVPVVYHPLAPVHLPGDVYRYMTGSKVKADLPALNGAIDPLDGTVPGGLACVLRVLARTGGVTADPTDDRTREPKSVAEHYKETHRMLLRYGNVGQVSDLAPIWQRLANCTKSEQFTIMTQEMQKICLARGLATELYTTVVTTGLTKQMVNGFQFVGHGADDLGTGCQPFLVAYSGGTHHLQALANASIGNQLEQGDQNAGKGQVSQGQ